MKDLLKEIDEYYRNYSKIKIDILKEIKVFISEYGKDNMLKFDEGISSDFDYSVLVETDRMSSSNTWEYVDALHMNKDGDVYVEAGGIWENIMYLPDDGIINIYSCLNYLESKDNDEYIIEDGIVKYKEE